MWNVHWMLVVLWVCIISVHASYKDHKHHHHRRRHHHLHLHLHHDDHSPNKLLHEKQRHHHHHHHAKDLTVTAVYATTLDRLRTSTLSVGCPEFQLAFEAASNSSSPSNHQDTLFKSFTVLKSPAYAYIVVHFARYWMPPGTYALLRGVEYWTRTDTIVNITDTMGSGKLHQDVYISPIQAKELRIEFYQIANYPIPSTIKPKDACYGFFIDSYYYRMSDPDDQSKDIVTPNTEEICLRDNTKAAICYYGDTTTRTMYLASRPVARLSIKKGQYNAACTGWLLGSAGHLITNNHCVSTQAEASQTKVEFMADGTACTNECMVWGGCRGQVEAISTTLVYTNAALDYSILKLQTSTNLAKKYGFLRFKTTPGQVGQQVYIPQHPRFHGKRISMVDDRGNRVTLLNLAATAPSCSGVGYSYSGDTDGGSSGAPVLDAQDHGVVALHHCGVFCANIGVPSTQIVQDMLQNNVLPPQATDADKQRNDRFFPSYTPPSIAAPKRLLPQVTINSAIYVTSTRMTVDQVEFTLTKDADVEFDVLSVEISDDTNAFVDVNGDSLGQYMDAILFLYPQKDRTVLLSSDDARADQGLEDGSISRRDPYVRASLRPGSYMLAISALPADALSAFDGSVALQYAPDVFNCDDHGSIGKYRLTIASSEPLTITKSPRNLSTRPRTTTKPICPVFRFV